MRLKKISIVSLALILSSVSFNVYAFNGKESISTRAIISDSVVIDKGNSNGGTILPPTEVLNDENIGTWGNGDIQQSSNGKKPTRKGSIKISLPDTSDKHNKSGVQFSLSKVADIVNGRYELVEGYTSSGVDLNDLKTSNDLDIAANLLRKSAISDKVISTDENGVVSVGDLDVGVYLLYASNIAKYENITPFLVSIPVWNDIDKSMSYDVEVIPKHNPIPKEDTSKSKAPSTGYSGGDIYGVLSGLSLVTGTGVLFLNRKKED